MEVVEVVVCVFLIVVDVLLAGLLVDGVELLDVLLGGVLVEIVTLDVTTLGTVT